MDFLRSIGLLFLFFLVPLGALLVSYPVAIADGLSALFGVAVTRGNLAAGFLLLTVVCLKIDLTLRRRAQARAAA
nr:hypothetical protein [uncultured Pseudomonas sp.]